MVILHVACISESKTNGVCIAVQQHVEAQGQYAETALVNISGVELDRKVKQLPYRKPFDIQQIPEPFDQPDIVVFHECYRPEYLNIAKDLKKKRIPYVIIPHGELREEAQRKKHFKKALANFLLFNRFVNGALAVQCLSENEMEATHFGKKKILGTNGVFLPQREKEIFRDKGAVFLYIGRYEWRVKGLDLLFDSIKKEEDFLRKNQCRFIMYGPDIYGRLAAVSAMVEERKIGDLVSLNHEIIGEDKEKALLDADVFIQTSRHEGMPMGILEAMGYALPCLITDGTSLGPDIRKAHAGWVANTTVQSISASIVDAVNGRSHWQEFGKNGRITVNKYFSWDKIASDTIKMYHELISLSKE